MYFETKNIINLYLSEEKICMKKLKKVNVILKLTSCTNNENKCIKIYRIEIKMLSNFQDYMWNNTQKTEWVYGNIKKFNQVK